MKIRTAKKHDELRKQTCIIIRKHGEYLMGACIWTSEPRWGASMYDAWRTRNKEAAKRMARATGGVMVLFNPIVGQTRVI